MCWVLEACSLLLGQIGDYRHGFEAHMGFEVLFGGMLKLDSRLSGFR